MNQFKPFNFQGSQNQSKPSVTIPLISDLNRRLKVTLVIVSVLVIPYNKYKVASIL